MVPAGVFLTNKTPYIFCRYMDKKLLGYLLGIFSSRIFDWQLKRFVELGLSFSILNSMRIPQFDPQNSKHLEISRLAWQILSRDGSVDFWKPDFEAIRGLGSVSKSDVDELDEMASRVYGLSEAQIIHVFDSIPYPSSAK
jgi:hypothetical protein